MTFNILTKKHRNQTSAESIYQAQTLKRKIKMKKAKKIRKIKLMTPIFPKALTLKDIKAFYRQTDWQLPSDKTCLEYLKFYLKAQELTLAERCTLYADPILRFHKELSEKSGRLEARTEMLKNSQRADDIYTLLSENLQDIKSDLTAYSRKLEELGIAVRVESRGFSTNWFIMSLNQILEKTNGLVTETNQAIDAAISAVKSKNPTATLKVAIGHLTSNVVRKTRRIPVFDIAGAMKDLAEAKNISEREPPRAAMKILQDAGLSLQSSVLHQVTSREGRKFERESSHLSSTVEMSQWSFWREFQIIQGELNGKY